MHRTKRAAALQQGVIVMVVLAALTILEFWIGIATRLWTLLGLIALIKAIFVVQYYMHLARVFSEEGEH